MQECVISEATTQSGVREEVRGRAEEPAQVKAFLLQGQERVQPTETAIIRFSQQ
jgi:hypothetical protein